MQVEYLQMGKMLHIQDVIALAVKVWSIVKTDKKVYQLVAHWVIFLAFCHLLIFFKINFFEKVFQEYHLSVKQIGFRSGPIFYRA